MNKVKVIIADDNKSFSEALSYMLTKDEKFEVIEICENGYDLIKSNRLTEANILLIDIDMPMMNGFEAALKLNNKYPNLPKIAISSKSWNDYPDFIVSGFKCLVHKDEIPKKLIDTIIETLI